MSQTPDLIAAITPAVLDRPDQRPRPSDERSSQPFADTLEAERSEHAASSPSDQAVSADTGRKPEEQQQTESGDAGSASPSKRSPSESDETPVDAAQANHGEPLTDQPLRAGDATMLPTDLALAQELIAPNPEIIAETANAPTGEEASTPGGLAQWFARTVSTPTQSPSNAGQTSPLPATQAQVGQPSGPLAPQGETLLTADRPSSALPGDGEISFADAMAASNSEADLELADQLVSRPLAKTVGPSDPQSGAPTGLAPVQSASGAAQPIMTAVPQATTGQAVPVAALAVEIVRQAVNGKTQFDIRLDPPELGRVSVRLEMDAAGNTRTHMIVERSETLEMLLTDARSLERALQQAGLKSDPGSVSMELAGDGTEAFQDNHDQGANQSSGEGEDGSVAEPEGADPTLTGDGLPDIEAIRGQLQLTGNLDVRV